uniref:NADH-ubiquinone oxidoreductase chain 4L n=1 Tax=Grypocephalus pallipectus TaxID=2813436 RepID=A0A8T9ZXI9_9HEMI|nr:NADH dehydrogenase subunit 4L [Grypocephalus pallipectus]UNA71183.1 NADH dehydrogenase subunit 4L [Grypocephalus pallipectus]UPL65775.1 NADH dehydrogenase subunit 4L [Grypocephalus pallipectus]
MILINFCLVFMFVSGVIVFSSTRKHLLLTLFSLEFMVLCLYLGLILLFIYCGFELYFVMVFLVFSVCEGALGLGILVNMIRSHGNDLLSSLSILSW